MITRAFLRLCLGVYFFLLVVPSMLAAERAPNIILIFADDLGWRDVGYQGKGYIETPNIDRFAREGMIFSHGYAAMANCQPSRACLLSGKYTPRHDVYAVNSTKRGEEKMMRLIPIPNKSGLNVKEVTMADSLKAAGYKTGIFGKWHLGGPEGASPTLQGFDVALNSFGNGILKGGSGGNLAGPPEDPKGVYTLTREACRFIEKNKDQPFFCYLSHNAIHTPLQARAESLKKFKSAQPSDNVITPLYAACVYDLDDSVGLLLKKLKELKLDENTLIIFTSDNGGTNQSPQEPLRGNKGGYYEGGIRVPFLARWPGKIKPGSKSDVPVINVDLYPTFLEVAGIKRPKELVLDGESLTPLFEGKSLRRSAIYWHFPGYLDRPVIRGRDPVFRTRPVSVIRKGDWKLMLYLEEWVLEGGRKKIAENNAIELYNLKNDVGERKNLATSEIQKRDELLEDLLHWHRNVQAKIPTTPNPNYDATFKPRKKK